MPAAPSSEASWISINTLRVLAMDAVEAANSGHPGTPMALAPAAYILWTKFLRHSPRHPEWPDRDRFVLSSGHASMLLYGLLHLSGYDLPMEEVKRFRQWGSATPGHPERGHTPGVEVTTGPLGQGVGNAVGMAMAERFLAQRFNRPDHTVVGHRVWAFVSDGDLMEGVASEAASLAGHLKLDKLTLVYDDNHITIDGDTRLAFSEEVGGRFHAYGWHVQHVADGNDLVAIEAALAAAASSDRPSLIVMRTHIADPAPTKRDTPEAHGAPLGADEVRRTKEILGWPVDEAFHVPGKARADMGRAVARGGEWVSEWEDRVAAYRAAFPEPAGELDRWLAGTLPQGWDAGLPSYGHEAGSLATRQASAKCLEALSTSLGNLVGGSADLAGSTGTKRPAAENFNAERAGPQVHWGIREHGMAACLNGMAAHGGVHPFGSTFLVFSDYMKPSMRLAAIMKLPVVYLGTHDSIGVGEDGPTHQPIEHLAMLRAVPNLVVLRPADAAETVEAWKAAIQLGDGPAILALTRQKLPILDRSRYGAASGVARGAYILFDPPKPRAIVMASGSEVAIALAAAEALTAEGSPTRVVSFPSWELFERQSEGYRAGVLPPALRARVSIEAAATLGWSKYTTDDGIAIGLDHFGASAPQDEIYRQFDLTAARVVRSVREVLSRSV